MRCLLIFMLIYIIAVVLLPFPAMHNHPHCLPLSFPQAQPSGSHHKQFCEYANWKNCSLLAHLPCQQAHHNVWNIRTNWAHSCASQSSFLGELTSECLPLPARVLVFQSQSHNHTCPSRVWQQHCQICISARSRHPTFPVCTSVSKLTINPTLGAHWDHSRCSQRSSLQMWGLQLHLWSRPCSLFGGIWTMEFCRWCESPVGVGDSGGVGSSGVAQRIKCCLFWNVQSVQWKKKTPAKESKSVHAELREYPLKLHPEAFVKDAGLKTNTIKGIPLPCFRWMSANISNVDQGAKHHPPHLDHSTLCFLC